MRSTSESVCLKVSPGYEDRAGASVIGGCKGARRTPREVLASAGRTGLERRGGREARVAPTGAGSSCGVVIDEDELRWA